MQANDPVPAAGNKRRVSARWWNVFRLYNLLIFLPCASYYFVIRQRHHDVPAWLMDAALLVFAGWFVGAWVIVRTMESGSVAPGLKEPRV
jgi:hypothetical protein